MNLDIVKSGSNRSGWLQHPLFLILLVALVLWLPRAFSLDTFVATDELPWLVRSANFYYALGQQDYPSTYTAEHPGVITMWIETATYLLDFPEYRGFGQGYFESDKYHQYEDFLKSKGVDPHDLLITSRRLMVLVNTLVLTIAFFYSRVLFGTIPSLLGFGLIAFDPFHNAITRMAHLDGPTSSLLFLALLAFLVFLHAGRKVLHLIISALCGALAWLAKLPGLIILPTIFFMAVIDILTHWKNSDNSPGQKKVQYVKKQTGRLFIWAAVFVLSTVIFFPATWVNPFGVLKEMTLSPLAVGRVLPVEMENGDLTWREPASSIPESDETPANNLPFFDKPPDYYLRYPRRYIWDTTPVVLFGLVFALAAYIKKFNIFNSENIRKSTVGLLMFVLFYTIFLTLAAKTSDKYYLPVHTVLDLIAGLGWFAVLHHLIKPLRSQARNYFFYAALAGVIVMQAIPALRTYPYYSTYFNTLLGGGQAAGQRLVIGSGEGLNLAAQYLNQKPGAEGLQAISWYGIGPFSYYFNGETSSLFSSVWDEDKIEELKESDYLIIYNHQWKLDRPVGLMDRLAGVKPEQSIWINGIEYARIYDVRQLPTRVYQPHGVQEPY